MIKANFKAYATYVTDSLNQWDIDQALQVTGLNLTSAPEVHFSNANTDRAIVRQASLDKGVVSVAIPNSLLQDPLRIYAHVGIYEGSTFKVVELVEIPVKPRKRPEDYQIQDSDEELYSFKRLENMLANAATKDQVANIVGNVGRTAEVVDIRYGADGKTYASAGEAVREQMMLKADRGDVDRMKEVVSFNYQFLDHRERIAGEYWSTAPGGQLAGYSASGYYRLPAVTNLPAGVYHWVDLSLNFSWIENLSTGEFTKLSEFTSGDTRIDIGHPFNLYATVSGVDKVAMFGSDVLPAEYLFGPYGVQYLGDAPHVFYCGPTREYTKLKDAIEAAEAFMGATLYVDRATYDLVEEFGSGFFDGYTSADGPGIVLKNNVHIIFEQGAKVVCDYTGRNENVHTYFSPFNAGPYGFTLENAWVESVNTRYTIHDELSGSVLPNRNIYKRCTFIHDSTGTSWGAHQAVGGGFGSWGDVLFEDCHVSAAGCDAVLTYHNAGYENHGLTDYASKLVVRGCYLEGTVRVNSTGYGKKLTHAYVSGNSLAAEPISGKTTADAADNVVLHAWGNTIRS